MSTNELTNGCYVLPGPMIRFGRRRVSAFRLFGCLGLTTGVTINITLSTRLNLPLKFSVGAALVGLVAIPVIAMLEKIITGHERLCFYHHLIGALTAITFLLWIMGQPLLPFLDVLTLGAGAVRAIGYFGCLRAGCCHGRPCRWGVMYDDRYTHVLPPALLGVRLIPVQLLEALWTTGIVAIGCTLIVRQYEPGIAFSWFIVTYCSARFFFGWLRWPPNFHFKSGLSQHQWISAGLVLLVVGLEVSGVLPFRLWHAVILFGLLAATTALVIERRTRNMSRELGHPEHIRELAAAMRSLSQLPGSGIPVDCTSLGLQVSAGKIQTGRGDIHHYTFSRRKGLTKAAVDLLARAVTQAGRVEVLAGNNNAFHLLIHPTRRHL